MTFTVILSNFVFLGVALHPFRIKYGIIILKHFVTYMNEATPFVTKSYKWADGVEQYSFKRYVIIEWFHTFENWRLSQVFAKWLIIAEMCSLLRSCENYFVLISKVLKLFHITYYHQNWGLKCSLSYIIYASERYIILSNILSILFKNNENLKLFEILITTLIRILKILRSCYRTVPSEIFEIFSEFLIFCNL